MLKYLSLIPFLLFFGSLLPDSFSDDFSNSIFDAQQFQYLGKFNSALLEYDAILDVDPANVLALKNKGYLLNDHGKYSDSMFSFHAVLVQYPNNVDSLTGMAIVLSNLGEYKSALYLFDKVLSIDSNDTLSINYKTQIVNMLEKSPYLDTSKNYDLEFIIYDKQTLQSFLLKIFKNISSEKRYIPTINPSDSVWINYNNKDLGLVEPDVFLDPVIFQDVVPVIHYIVFINILPADLPFDYYSLTLQSLEYWEEQSIYINDVEYRVDFLQVDDKNDANVWIDFTAKSIPTVGISSLGKGLALISLGDFSCNNSFELYDEKTINHTLKHEIGHIIGLGHSVDENNVMFDTVHTSYAFCPSLF